MTDPATTAPGQEQHPALSAAPQASSPYYCTLRTASPGGGYALYGRIRLNFPDSALAADGQTSRYVFRVLGRDGAVRWYADCVIPRTEEAVKIMDRRFRIRGSISIPKPVTGRPGDITTQECYQTGDGEYFCDDLSGGDGGGSSDPTLEPTLEPTCDTDDPDCETGGSAGGGRETTTYAEPGDEDEFNCHYEVDCDLYDADAAQKEAIKTAIEKHISPDRCPEVYNTASSLVGTAQLWDKSYQDPVTGGTIRGDYDREANQMHVWKGNFDSPDYWLPWVIAHEATHAVEYQLGLTSHQQVHDYGDACLNFPMQH